jgi:hypothetical protein
MVNERILASWIGHADLSAMADDSPGPERDAILQRAGIRGKYGDGPGPLKTAVTKERFDEVHLLSNYDPALHVLFKRWLGVPAVIHSVQLGDSTDYSKVFEITDRFLAQVTARPGRGPIDLSIHLSPGTPAMAAIWVLLGKSRYPATYYQSHKGRLWKTEIPFDLAVDYVPQLLRGADATF